MFSKDLVEQARSPAYPLLSETSLLDILERLRAHLAIDRSPDVLAELKTSLVSEALSQPRLFQRQRIPGSQCFTTSDPSRLDISDPGFLNTLGNHLTAEEGCLLRPLPKWAYLEPILPCMAGKSVLEIGCNNGFFCFEFGKTAATVTGIDVFDEFLQSAHWLKDASKAENVNFIHTDAMLDLTLPKADIVFMSEVYTHIVDPFYGILRAVNLSKELLIIDNATLNGSDYKIDVGAGLDPATGRLTYHAWILSDGLVLTYLFLCGIPPERVTRYIAPWQNHIVYIIDTSDVARFRDENDFNPCNTSFIKMRHHLSS